MAVSDEPRTAEAVAMAYFDALARRDADAMGALWAPDGIDHIAGIADLRGGEQVREYFAAMLTALPDLEATVLATVAEDDHVAVRWRVTGTFAAAPYKGLEPTGERVCIEGTDVLRVRDGRIARIDAHLDTLGFVRQLGLLPPRGSKGMRLLKGIANTRTRIARGVAAAEPERAADGVWLVRGGAPRRTMNVYFIEDDGGGVTVFDAGIQAMTTEVAAFGATRGGINRVVLGHAHADHRGAAPGLAAPVLCHPLDRADAEGDGGDHYFKYDELNALGRVAYPRLLRHWDGGPVQIAATVEEGDEIAGFRVVHLPGHAPGLIALFRERDGVALTTDCFYAVDPETGRYCAPRVPHRAFNLDTEQARESVRRLAELDPTVACPGHADPVRGDVRSQLQRAADAA